MSTSVDELTKDAPARKPPKVVPYALLALGSTAMVVPFLLLRRARARVAVNEIVQGPHRHVVQSTPLNSRVPEPQVPEQPLREEPLLKPGTFDPLLAFGIATFVVGASALAGVWAVRRSLGVQSTEEFAERMRKEVQALAPVLSSRIHRPPVTDITSHDSSIANEPATLLDAESEAWTWDGAMVRLSRAYEEGGLTSWMEAATQELEREARLERMKRGHSEHEEHSTETRRG